MFAARDSSLWVIVTKVALRYSSVHLVQNILPLFPCVPEESCTPGIRRPVLTTPGWAARDTSTGAETHSGGVTGTRCFSPQAGSVAPGHQMRMGIYRFLSLLRVKLDGLAWSCLHTGLSVVLWMKCVAQHLCSALPGEYIHLPSYWTGPTYDTEKNEMKKSWTESFCILPHL